MRHTSSYTASAKPFDWSDAKNERLKRERQISFEEITRSIAAGGLVDVKKHPNEARYPGQRLLVVAVEGYAYLIPFVERPDGYFLKTIIPSRKATRDYLKDGNDNGASQKIGG